MLGLPGYDPQHVTALRLCTIRLALVADTELLYATDAYLRAFDAHVAELTPEGSVILDRTAFYPTGGGQPHDLGALSWDGRSASVVEVKKSGALVVHRLEGDLPTVGSAVHGE